MYVWVSSLSVSSSLGDQWKIRPLLFFLTCYSWISFVVVVVVFFDSFEQQCDTFSSSSSSYPFVILSRAQRRTQQNRSYRMQAKRKSLCDTLLFIFLCHSMKSEQTRSSRVSLFTGSFQCNAQSIHMCTDTVFLLFSSPSCLLTHFLYMCDASSLLVEVRARDDVA